MMMSVHKTIMERENEIQLVTRTLIQMQIQKQKTLTQISVVLVGVIQMLNQIQV